MTLDNIGFYTLTNKRAQNVATCQYPPLSRCEILLTGRCNFRCPYCRHVGGPDISINEVIRTLDLWIKDDLHAVRFSGGEPTLWPELLATIKYASRYIPRVAISTNGSAPWKQYESLIQAGANDFSISLDACCAADGEQMAGGVPHMWERVIDNIRCLSRQTYVTVGVVLTPDNQNRANEIICLAAQLGVSDIRVIPAAQYAATIKIGVMPLDQSNGYPILRWRWNRFLSGAPVRGITPRDCIKCSLVLDDMAVMGNQHYPCIIYLREGGKAIGAIGPNMREERRSWYESHRSDQDPICSTNCLDFCVQYNNQVNVIRQSNQTSIE